MSRSHDIIGLEEAIGNVRHVLLVLFYKGVESRVVDDGQISSELELRVFLVLPVFGLKSTQLTRFVLFGLLSLFSLMSLMNLLSMLGLLSWEPLTFLIKGRLCINLVEVYLEFVRRVY